MQTRWSLFGGRSSDATNISNGNVLNSKKRDVSAPFQLNLNDNEFSSNANRSGGSNISSIDQAYPPCRYKIDYRNFKFKQLDSLTDLKFSTYCGPTSESNWVIPGVLLVGAYPASQDDEETIELLTSILGLGIRKFVCLQKEYRSDVTEVVWRSGQAIRPYFDDVIYIVKNKHLFHELKDCNSVVDIANLGFEHCPIVDCGITDDVKVLELARKLVYYISIGEILYIHCWGGHGRTGTIVSIMLHIMYGLSPTDAMRRCQAVHDIRRCRVDVGSPQTQTQRDQVSRIINKLMKMYSDENKVCVSLSQPRPASPVSISPNVANVRRLHHGLPEVYNPSEGFEIDQMVEQNVCTLQISINSTNVSRSASDIAKSSIVAEDPKQTIQHSASKIGQTVHEERDQDSPPDFVVKSETDDLSGSQRLVLSRQASQQELRINSTPSELAFTELPNCRQEAESPDDLGILHKSRAMSIEDSPHVCKAIYQPISRGNSFSNNFVDPNGPVRGLNDVTTVVLTSQSNADEPFSLDIKSLEPERKKRNLDSKLPSENLLPASRSGDGDPCSGFLVTKEEVTFESIESETELNSKLSLSSTSAQMIIVGVSGGVCSSNVQNSYDSATSKDPFVYSENSIRYTVANARQLIQDEAQDFKKHTNQPLDGNRSSSGVARRVVPTPPSGVAPQKKTHSTPRTPRGGVVYSDPSS